MDRIIWSMLLFTLGMSIFTPFVKALYVEITKKPPRYRISTETDGWSGFRSYKILEGGGIVIYWSDKEKIVLPPGKYMIKEIDD